jgi:hypothetical protein
MKRKERSSGRDVSPERKTYAVNSKGKTDILKDKRR